MTATTNAPGSPAAGLTRSSAQPGRAVQGSPTGPSSASRAAVPLTARPREATPTTYHPYQPPMSPEPGCVIHAQISEKDSDTGHFNDPRLAKAVVDRLTHRAHIIDTGTESWRFRHGLKRKSRTAAR